MRSAPPARFEPTYVDIKGFVDNFAQASTHGVTPERAKEIIEILKGQLSENLRESVGELGALRPKSFSIRVPIIGNMSESAHEWRAHLRANPVNGRDLYLTVERSPEEKKKYAGLGKIRRYLEQEVKRAGSPVEGFNVRVFWGRDMCAYVENTSGEPHFIAEVTDTGANWDPDGLKLLQCTSQKQANHKVLVASSTFR